MGNWVNPMRPVRPRGMPLRGGRLWQLDDEGFSTPRHRAGGDGSAKTIQPAVQCASVGRLSSIRPTAYWFRGDIRTSTLHALREHTACVLCAKIATHSGGNQMTRQRVPAGVESHSPGASSRGTTPLRGARWRWRTLVAALVAGRPRLSASARTRYPYVVPRRASKVLARLNVVPLRAVANQTRRPQ